MKNTALHLLLGGALASAFLAVGLTSLSLKFDPVMRKAQSEPCIRVIAEQPGSLYYPGGPTQRAIEVSNQVIV